MYIVVRMEGKEAIPTHDYYAEEGGLIPEDAEDPSPKIYTDASTAQDWANWYTQNFACKYQVRLAGDGDKNWIEREQKRMDSGEYVKVPWHNEAWVTKNADCANHFVHVSKEDPTRIAFTQDAKKGERDVQTRMAASKYLKQHYSKYLMEDVIREWCARYRKEYGADYELRFAYTADEIEHVYANGPQSCMKGIRAVRAYAGPDLAVAYIVRKEKITARTVCWPEKKLYCSLVYGDHALLTEVLHELGYQSSYRFKGAKMSKIKEGGHILLPSIEMAHHGYDYQGDEHIVIL